MHFHRLRDAHLLQSGRAVNQKDIQVIGLQALRDCSTNFRTSSGRVLSTFVTRHTSGRGSRRRLAEDRLTLHVHGGGVEVTQALVVGVANQGDAVLVREGIGPVLGNAARRSRGSAVLDRFCRASAAGLCRKTGPAFPPRRWTRTARGTRPPWPPPGLPPSGTRACRKCCSSSSGSAFLQHGAASPCG